LPFRDFCPNIANLLWRTAGHREPARESLLGAWMGASWAIRLKAETLYKVIAVLLVVIAGALFFAHDATVGATLLSGTAQLVAGVSLVSSSA
jgi:hypothetical protein